MSVRGYFLIIFASFFLGILLFLFYNGWIIVSIAVPNIKNFKNDRSISIKKNKINLWYPGKDSIVSESLEILWDNSSPEKNLEQAIKKWILINRDSGFIKKCSLQGICISQDAQELIVSFSHSPFRDIFSIFGKFLLLKSLIRTISGVSDAIENIRFLVCDRPLKDNYLDFLLPVSVGFGGESKKPKIELSVESCGSIKLLDVSLGQFKNRRPLTVVLNPSRGSFLGFSEGVIGSELRDRLPLKFCQSIKNFLEEKISDKRFILTRTLDNFADRTSEVFFANMLKADFYLDFNFFDVKKSQRHIYIYYFDLASGGVFGDFEDKENKDSELIKFYRAHLKNRKKTEEIAEIVFKNLVNSKIASDFVINSPIGLPLMGLGGIRAPAIMIEVGLKGVDDIELVTSEFSQLFYKLLSNSVCH